MADSNSNTSTTQTPQEAYTGEERRSQASWDQSFASILGQQSQIDASQWVQAYFEQADQTIRTARRVAELHVFSQMKRDIVTDVVSMVLSEIQRNPSLLAQQQSSSSQSNRGGNSS